MKQVRESAAAQKISAYIITKKGKFIANVHVLHNDTKVVDVWTNKGLIYQGKAGGYGYDKFAAAISGAVIDGNKIYNHCGQDDYSKKMLTKYKGLKTIEAKNKFQDQIQKKGLQFANYGENGYMDLYYVSGLDRLKYLGYVVHQAI